MYGVGNGGGVYTIDPTTAQATFVNALSVPLSGKSFGVDFDPAADRLRIVSDTGQNLAHNVNAGGVTAANGVLTYTVPPAAAVPAAGITAAAYTNNDLNQPATATTLFDLDTMQDQVVIQSPPGAGILVATGMLGVDAGADAGFDIYSQLSSGVTVANVPLATLMTNGKYHLLPHQPDDRRRNFSGDLRPERRRHRHPVEAVTAPLFFENASARRGYLRAGGCGVEAARHIVI